MKLDAARRHTSPLAPANLSSSVPQKDSNMATKIDWRTSDANRKPKYELEVELIEDLDLSDNEVPAPLVAKTSTIFEFTRQEEQDFASLLFPVHSVPKFPSEWKGKGFQFQESPGLTYGLIQIKVISCNEGRSMWAFGINTSLVTKVSNL
jgi:hypothetical protein